MRIVLARPGRGAVVRAMDVIGTVLAEEGPPAGECREGPFRSEGSPMTPGRIPLEDNLDLLISFASMSPAIGRYEEHARSKGLRIVMDDIAPEYRLFKAHGFGLMLVDGHLARLHGVGLFDEPEEDTDPSLGVAVASSMEQLRELYLRLRHQLAERLGAPNKDGSWRARSVLQEGTEVECAYASWRFEESILVLLFNDEGDAHIGEFATVDIRIAPLSYETGLPERVAEPFGWPVED